MKIETGQGTIPLITLLGIWSISALNALPGLAVSPILDRYVYNISAFFGVRHTTVIFTTFAIDYTFHLVIREVDRTY